jgi:hypothetical protein
VAVGLIVSFGRAPGLTLRLRNRTFKGHAAVVALPVRGAERLPAASTATTENVNAVPQARPPTVAVVAAVEVSGAGPPTTDNTS